MKISPASSSLCDILLQVDAVRVVHNDKLFKNNPDLEIFEKEYKEDNNSNVIGSSEKCIDQVKQSCHTVEGVKMIEHEMKNVLERLIKRLFGMKTKFRWVRSSLLKLFVHTSTIIIFRSTLIFPSRNHHGNSRSFTTASGSKCSAVGS